MKERTDRKDTNKRRYRKDGTYKKDKKGRIESTGMTGRKEMT